MASNTTTAHQAIGTSAQRWKRKENKVGTSLRPEASSSYDRKITPRNEALRLVYKAVARRRSLIKAKLKDGEGHFCAIGCLGYDLDTDKTREPVCVVASFVDEVAAVNDKLSDRVSPKRRWEYVMRWLRKEIAKLDSEANRQVEQGKS
jgi:hypothetical protein